jgi:hypothetical protein
MSAAVTRHKFTAEEYYRLYETGFFTEEDGIKLINGDLNVKPTGLPFFAPRLGRWPQVFVN